MTPADTTKPDAMLSHLSLVDIATPLAYDCGRIFATLGADVVRVDRGPVDGQPGWAFGNRGKRPRVLDYAGADRDAFVELVAGSDILIESFMPGTLAAMGLLLAIHLGFVLALFAVLPYSKMVHGVYRLLALIQDAAERRASG